MGSTKAKRSSTAKRLTREALGKQLRLLSPSGLAGWQTEAQLNLAWGLVQGEPWVMDLLGLLMDMKPMSIREFQVLHFQLGGTGSWMTSECWRRAVVKVFEVRSR